MSSRMWAAWFVPWLSLRSSRHRNSGRWRLARVALAQVAREPRSAPRQPPTLECAEAFPCVILQLRAKHRSRDLAGTQLAHPASTASLSSVVRARLAVAAIGLMRMAVILLRFLRRISKR